MYGLIGKLPCAIAQETSLSLINSSTRQFALIAPRQLLAAILVLFALGAAPATVFANPKPLPPNILFVIMDDVGIDQMELFGYGGIGSGDDGRTPQLPTIGAIATEGIAFRNTWSMPACSTSRAVFFTGRYPLRTNVLGALGPDDLANAQVSPFEISLPTLLKKSGYQSALFGKFHLGLQDNNPFAYAMPSALGWDYYYGWLDVTGDPSSIDTTAGLGDPTVEAGPYSCGFVPRYDPESPEGMHGADVGACYTAKGKCQELAIENGIPPGRACRDSGGILDPGKGCKKKMPANIEHGFQNLSAHYVSPLVINTKNGKVEKIPPTDIRARTFRGTAPVDAAIDWIQRQPKGKPWMASVSFSSAHTPAQQPPQHLIDTDPEFTSSLRCATDPDNPVLSGIAQRELTTQLIEALDTELARLLVTIGIASRNEDGALNYSAAENKDTMVVILGDNGTLGNIVKLPFDPTRAKGTAYQTGVWVPLIVAGPLVNDPNREVRHMVNIADLYQLFGEIAGIDVHASVPRQLDSQTMLPYLQTAEAESVRELNFTQVGPNVQAGGTINGPCVIGNGCTQIPVTQGVCTDNGGVWWGEDSPVPGNEDGQQYCCEVNQFLYNQAVAAIGGPQCDPTSSSYDPDVCNPTYVKLQPLTSLAIRNDLFKVVRNSFLGNPDANPYNPDVEPSCDDPGLPDEFYAIDETKIDPKIDREKDNLIDGDGNPPAHLAEVYEYLEAKLELIIHSEPPCPIHVTPWTLDGNLDGVIDDQDLSDLEFFAELAMGGSSWYDVNLDGYTDDDDFDLVAAGLGTNCAPE